MGVSAPVFLVLILFVVVIFILLLASLIYCTFRVRRLHQRQTDIFVISSPQSADTIQLKRYHRLENDPESAFHGMENPGFEEEPGPSSRSSPFLPEDSTAIQLERASQRRRRQLESSPTEAESPVEAQHKLRRQLAEAIANDKVAENSVVFDASSSSGSTSGDVEVVFKQRTAV